MKIVERKKYLSFMRILKYVRLAFLGTRKGAFFIFFEKVLTNVFLSHIIIVVPLGTPILIHLCVKGKMPNVSWAFFYLLT